MVKLSKGVTENNVLPVGKLNIRGIKVKVKRKNNGKYKIVNKDFSPLVVWGAWAYADVTDNFINKLKYREEVFGPKEGGTFYLEAGETRVLCKKNYRTLINSVSFKYR